ncbi:MAG: sugar phosphate isomerase/epimerase [Oscillospiraceae bacterium]|nr:sugar phosphate isomerase/epimerase [Oscillospiraceae bacterium]
MEIGVSSACFYPLPVENAVDRLIALGFPKAEIFVNTESEYHPTFCKNMRKKLNDGGVDVVSLHSYTAAFESLYFFSGYSRRVNDAIDIYHRYFEAAAILGAEYFTFHGERTPGQVGFGGTSVEHHCEVLFRLAEAAKQHGIIVTQENVSWCASSDPNYIRALHDNLGDKIGFTLDLKQARRVNVPWQEYADAMGDRLLNLHISDGKAEKTSLLPGQGEFNYHQFFGYLEKIGYSNSLLIEVYSRDFSDDSEFLTAKDFLTVEMGRI